MLLIQWELCFTSLRRKYVHQLFETLYERFVYSPPFMYLFNHIYIYQYRLRGIYFILYDIIHILFILLLKLFHLWPLGVIVVGIDIVNILSNSSKIFITAESDPIFSLSFQTVFFPMMSYILIYCKKLDLIFQVIETE